MQSSWEAPEAAIYSYGPTFFFLVVIYTHVKGNRKQMLELENFADAKYFIFL